MTDRIPSHVEAILNGTAKPTGKQVLAAAAEDVRAIAKKFGTGQPLDFGVSVNMMAQRLATEMAMSAFGRSPMGDFLSVYRDARWNTFNADDLRIAADGLREDAERLAKDFESHAEDLI